MTESIVSLLAFSCLIVAFAVWCWIVGVAAIAVIKLIIWAFTGERP